MTSTARAIVRPAAALIAVLLPAVVAGPALAATDDDALDQTIDASEEQGTGQVVIDQGHLDFGPTLNTGQWIIEIHDDTGTPSYWRMPEDVVMKVNDTGIVTAPDDDAYDFLGLEPGTDAWVIPQTQKTDVVWTGWNTQEPNVMSSIGLGVTMRVLGVDGPGSVTVYLQSGNFGEPQQLWTTQQAFPQELWVDVNTHTHANWVFSDPGVYLVTVEIAAELVDGQTVSATDTLRFAVGDETSTDEAFAAVPSTTADAADRETATESAAPAAGGDGEAEEGDGAVGTLLTVVGGAVVAAILIALIVVVIATNRAKARARAAARSSDEEQGS